MPRLTPFAVLILLPLLSAIATAAETSPTIEFNRDVRPILADHCFQCHGPDAAQRKANLRLDVEPTSEREGGPILIAGHPEKGELYRRVKSSDPDEKMPPPGKGEPLTDNELNILHRWITSGAKFEKHWSLLPIRHPNTPPIQTRRASEGLSGSPLVQARSISERIPHEASPNSSIIFHNSLDFFIAEKLIQTGLSQSPPADKPTLLRRVSFALTGLPPSLDEIETFLADPSPDAYDKTVDRLLASPRYGERLAVPWLDAARYADTSGYQSDGERYMWRWRDWVIEALNANLPFDQFTIEQLAGDLLPNATLEQKIATGFNRNHRGNAEGGIIPEEYAAEYVADRVETTATVWLGLTLGCCRCHDHKYDPFTQRDFYSLFAFFNNIPEKGRAIKIGNSPPYIQAPTRLQEEELRDINERHRKAVSEVFFNSWKLQFELGNWERSPAKVIAKNWYPTDDLAAHFTFDGVQTDQNEFKGIKTKGEIRTVSGPVGKAARFDGTNWLEIDKAGDFGFFDKFSLTAWIWIDENSEGGTIASRMVDEHQGEGYQLAIVNGRLQFNLSKRWLDDALRIETNEEVPTGQWRHVAATYDGSRVALGVKLYVDGKEQELNVLLDELNQSFATKEPLRVGAGGGANARFQGAIDEVMIFQRALAIHDIQALSAPQSLQEILAIDSHDRTWGQTKKIEGYFLEQHAPDYLRSAYRAAENSHRELTAFREQLPTVMVMEELPSPRETHILLRGQYDKPGNRVFPNTPAALPPLTQTRSASEEGSRTASDATSNATKVSSLTLPLGEGRGEDLQPGSKPESYPKSTLNLEPETSNSISSNPQSQIPNHKSASPNRLDLARWLVSRDNPLTARVIVNRFWQLHFGTGLVKTSEDFGRQGESPSHPDLLDHLAHEFQSDWDVKRLHRTIVTSATFRQSSQISNMGFMIGDLNSENASPKNPKSQIINHKSLDPDNRLLSRGPRLRLSAEMVRDQALAASGQLVEQLGGPSVKPLQPPGLWSELTGGDDYKPGQGADLVRRSLYTFWKRTIPPPTLSTFDSPTREACTVRDSRTNTPLQALALLNEPTFVSASRALAHRIIHEAQTPTDRITRAFLSILNRTPTSQELQILSIALHRNLQKHPADESTAYTLLCTTLLNLDEAITSQ